MRQTQRELDESLVAQNRNLKDEQILRKQILDKTVSTKEDEYEADTMHCGKVFGCEPSEEELFIQNKTKQLRFARDLLVTKEINFPITMSTNEISSHSKTIRSWLKEILRTVLFRGRWSQSEFRRGK